MKLKMSNTSHLSGYLCQMQDVKKEMGNGKSQLFNTLYASVCLYTVKSEKF